jgi:hypothetical protein
MEKIKSLTIDDLYEELAELAREEATSARDVWNDLVEEVVEGHVDLGELDPDQDIEGMKEILGAKWHTFKEELAEEAAAEADEYEADTTTRLEEDEKVPNAIDDEEDEEDDLSDGSKF